VTTSQNGVGERCCRPMALTTQPDHQSHQKTKHLMITFQVTLHKVPYYHSVSQSHLRSMRRDRPALVNCNQSVLTSMGGLGRPSNRGQNPT